MSVIDYTKYTKEELWCSICDDFFDLLKLASPDLRVMIANRLLDKMIEINPNNTQARDLKKRFSFKAIKPHKTRVPWIFHDGLKLQINIFNENTNR